MLNIPPTTTPTNNNTKSNKYKNIINAYQPNIDEVNYNTIDALLEK